MGSPVSVAIANMVMEEIEECALSTYGSPPKAWKRYVDDTFKVLRSDIVLDINDHLKSIHPSIQFTIERENDISLPFLDVLLKRQTDRKICTWFFRKPTHTDRYLGIHITLCHTRFQSSEPSTAELDVCLQPQF